MVHLVEAAASCIGRTRVGWQPCHKQIRDKVLSSPSPYNQGLFNVTCRVCVCARVCEGWVGEGERRASWPNTQAHALPCLLRRQAGVTSCRCRLLQPLRPTHAQLHP